MQFSKPQPQVKGGGEAASKCSVSTLKKAAQERTAIEGTVIARVVGVGPTKQQQ